MASFVRDVSLPAVTAGFVAVLVGFTSSVAIVFQAATALGADTAQISSWMWALGLGMGLTCIVLSLRYRVPVVTAWSTPGAAMLTAGAAGLGIEQATGAFVVSAFLIALAGFSGVFERLINRVPIAIASGMLAGVLLRFGLDAFVALETQFGLALAMIAAYVLLRRWQPRYAVVATLALGIVIAASRGLLDWRSVTFEIAQPVWVTPVFTVNAIVSVAIPLFLVTMASQNVPGVAVMRGSGFSAPISPLIGWTGATNLVLAPFGAFALNLAAITAAICMGREAHEDPSRRYVAAIAAGVFYCIVGIFGATVAAVFAAFPHELVVVIAGLALLGTIGNGLATALADEREREAALLTFLVTASGITLFGIKSAFWGLVAGTLALIVQRARKPAAAQSKP
jgi:benzoate membrane transport protein